LAQIVRENGTIAAYGSALEMTPVLPFGAYLFKAITLEILLIYITPWAIRARMIDILHKALGEGGLKPAVHGHFDLAQAAKAHEAVEAGKRQGAVLLDL